MQLEIVSAPGAGTAAAYTFPNERAVIIGRDAACDVHLDDEQCSRRHARLAGEQGAVTVVDLGSTNGVFVNGARCYRRALAPGDELRVGHTVLRISGVPSPANRTADLSITERPASVVVSLHHEQANLLGATATPLASAEGGEENRLLRELCEITQTVAASPDPSAAMRAVLEQTRERLHADTACVLVRGEDGAWAVRHVASGATRLERIVVSQTIIQAALQEGMAILSDDPQNDARFSPSASIVGQNLATAMCAPIKVKDAFVGVLFLDRRERGGVFKPMDLRFAVTVGNLLGLLLEKEQMQAEARQRERLATIGEVMAGLAHCVKNILAALKFSVGALQRAIEKPDLAAAGGFLGHVTTQEQRISDLVLDMLTYAKERVPERAEVDLGRLLESVAAPLRAQWAEDGIGLRLASDPACPRILAEEHALYRVFLNLFGNARDAIRARGDAPLKELAVTAMPTADGAGVEVRLRDTGTGIPADRLERIFDPFYSTKGSGGTGLGLAVSRKIVREHGGEISVESCPGAWTEFRVRLPVGHGAAPESP